MAVVVKQRKRLRKAERLLANPDAYFAKAEKRARKEIRKDIERDKKLTHA